MKNKHESPRAGEIAKEGLILLSQVGSGLHGVTVEGQDDRDEMGICIEPPGCVIGLESFEQYQYRTQPEGVRSGAGDLDLVIYSLRKWTRLAAAGNPTVLLLLFVPDSEVVVRCPYYGEQISSVRDLLTTRECGRKFMGYLKAQKEQMLGLRSKRTNRPELIGLHGFDTKFAYHAVRLGLQGIELLSTGNITLPIAEPARTWLRDIRLGKHTKQDVLDAIDHQYHQLERLTNSVDLPDNPDPARVDKWLAGMYLCYWEEHGLLLRQKTSPAIRERYSHGHRNSADRRHGRNEDPGRCHRPVLPQRNRLRTRPLREEQAAPGERPGPLHRESPQGGCREDGRVEEERRRLCL